MAQVDILTTRKEAKSLLPDTFPELKAIKIAFAAGAPARTPPGELTATPDPELGRGGSTKLQLAPSNIYH